MHKIAEVKRLRMLAARITYKPGWKIEWFEDLAFGHLVCAVSALVEDSYGRYDHKVPLQQAHTAFPGQYEGVSDESVIQLMRSWIWELEQHESDEWFKVDGVLLYNPHEWEGKDRGKVNPAEWKQTY